MILLIILSLISNNLICSCSGEPPEAIDKLIQKICTLARDKLHIEALTPANRSNVFHSMKDKLLISSKTKDLKTKAQIRLIVQGISILSIDDNYLKLCKHSNTSNKLEPSKRRDLFRGMVENAHLRVHLQKDTNSELSNNATDDGSSTSPSTAADAERRKLAEIKSLISKMESVMERTVKKDSTVAEKVKVANRLKQQFIEAFKRAYRTSDKLNTYIRLVEQGMAIAVENIVNSTSRRSKLDETTLVGLKALAEVPTPKDSKTDPVEPPQLHAKSSSSPRLTDVPDKTKPTPDSITSTTPFPGVTKQYGCSDILKDTCANLKGLDKFSCDYDGTTFEMQQVCDGNVDCPDGSDEKNCTQQVLGKIHSATQIMAKVEMSQNCFKSLIDKSFLIKQGELLAGLLNTQVDFLNKYTQRGLHIPQTRRVDKKDEKEPQKKRDNNQSIKELAFEVAVIVRSFANTLVNALCHMDEKLQKDIDDLLGANLDKEFEEMQIESRSAWLPSQCKCVNQYCANATNCNSRCKRFCFQSYSLQNFNCKSIKKGQSSVPLDVVCDGKLDCVDEADENNCPETTTEDSGLSKFEGSKIFDKTINLIKTKAMTKEFSAARVEMVELQACIQGLQKRSVSQNVDLDSVKYARDKCFTKLLDIFETILEEKELTKGEQELIYDVLLLVNEKIILALKHTNFGNKNIISSGSCYCRGSECAQVNCPQTCVRMCAVKTLLTNYNCSSSPGGNATVAIEHICNGKINCPNGEDELNCKTDVCRIHHLKVIRRNIKTLCQKYHGTNVGDVLDNWRTKVVSHLVVLEKSGDRLTPTVFKHTVSQMLNDLTLTYASLGHTRRQETDQTRLKKFVKLSQYIIEMLKECNK